MEDQLQQLLQRVSAMEGVIQQQQSQTQTLEGQLQATQQELAQSAQQRSQLEQQLHDATQRANQSAHAANMARGPEVRPLIDTRILGKPDTFNGEESKWKDWSVVTKTYAGVVCPALAHLMAAAEASPGAVPNATLPGEDGRADGVACEGEAASG